jgi:hypothetical protein
MILRNGKFSGKILRKIFRTGKFTMENFPPHVTSYEIGITINMAKVSRNVQGYMNVWLYTYSCERFLITFDL